MVFQIANATEKPACLVEQAVNHALDDAMRDAEALIMERLATVTLADLEADFHQRFEAHRAERRSPG